MTQHTPQTLGEAWAVFDRHGIPHPDMPLDESTFPVARVIIKIEAQRDDMLEACQGIMFELEKRWGCGDLVRMPHDNPQMEWLSKWSDKLKAAISKATQ